MFTLGEILRLPILPAVSSESRSIVRVFSRCTAQSGMAQQSCAADIVWKSRVTEAIGMSSSVGVAMGGAMVAVAGVAAGLAHGVVRGAAVGSNISQLALPGMNDDQASTAYLSAGDPSEVPSANAGRLLDDA